MAKWSLAALAAGLTLLGGCAAAGSATSVARSLRGDDLLFDLTPATEILSIWAEPGNDVRERALSVATGVPYRTLRAFYTTLMSCAPSDAEVARAIAVPDSGICGFGLDSAYRERASVDSLVFALALRGRAIAERIAADAGAYVPARRWKPVRVFFVIATRYLFDAVTLDPSLNADGPTVLFNLSEALNYGGNTDERMAIIERVLAHETFHAVLRQIEFGEPDWRRYHDPTNAFDYLSRVMLDEGVAHYVDWKERAGADTLFAKRLSSRERKAFDQLALACKRLRDPQTDPGAREEILGMAATGPIWSKYAAISGMFAAYRIERAWGRDSLRAAVVSGPREFRRLYAAAAAADTSLKRWPKELD